MAKISKRFYANRATQQHQCVEARFDSFHSDNIRGSVEFMVMADGGYMKVSMPSGEAMKVSQQLMKFATIVDKRKGK